ncbi:MAG: hypothetical protein WCY12_02130 [Candidatus Omnitrophota bacterium]
MKNIKVLLIGLLAILCLAQAVFADEFSDNIKREADYILACQYMVNDASYGAINDISGLPTWVVPRENGMAILGLIRASELLNDQAYLDRAQLSADYLVRIQETDGSWYDQYVYNDHLEGAGRSPTQPSEVMIAFYKLGYKSNRYATMKKAAQYLLDCQNVANKTGIDDGLICGGKDPSGNYYKWRWDIDNSYSYQALKAAQAWAIAYGDTAFAAICSQAAQRIISGINTYLYNGTVWYVAVDENGNPQAFPDFPEQHKNLPHWVQYAPQMLDLPATGVNSPAVGEWIKNQFQQADGSCIGYEWLNETLRTRKYPGLSFEPSLCWYDTGHPAYAENAIAWAESSRLWQKTADPNGLAGGWVDWEEISPEAGKIEDWWFRFIDTSFYYISAVSGGYDFNTYYKLNLNVPWYARNATYSSSGAAAAQMVLNYIRKGAGLGLLSQNKIYETAKGSQPRTSDLTPDQIDKVLGRFDPYDSLVSGWADTYDSLADGNPYQGYNFSVETFDPNTDPQAFNKYLRDICHWMAYTVTKQEWSANPELVALPNTPAVVPMFGDYNHWAVVKGFVATLNPAPDPHTDPWNAPNFDVLGFWLKDPLTGGLGQDTYKTAAECAATYFLPLNTTDKYRGKYLQVAEPPAMLSKAKAGVLAPKTDLANLQFCGLKSNSEMDLSSSKQLNKKHSWRDIIDTRLLADLKAKAAFESSVMGEPILVKRTDKANSDYYLVPFNKKSGNGKYLTSAIVVLDKRRGYFKEATWTQTLQEFPRIDKAAALSLLRKKLINLAMKDKRRLMFYMRLLQSAHNAQVTLAWEPNKYSASIYSPYWHIQAGLNTFIVTQEGEVFI